MTLFGPVNFVKIDWGTKWQSDIYVYVDYIYLGCILEKRSYKCKVDVNPGLNVGLLDGSWWKVGCHLQLMWPLDLLGKWMRLLPACFFPPSSLHIYWPAVAAQNNPQCKLLIYSTIWWKRKHQSRLIAVSPPIWPQTRPPAWHVCKSCTESVSCGGKNLNEVNYAFKIRLWT